MAKAAAGGSNKFAWVVFGILIGLLLHDALVAFLSSNAQLRSPVVFPDN